MPDQSFNNPFADHSDGGSSSGQQGDSINPFAEPNNAFDQGGSANNVNNNVPGQNGGVEVVNPGQSGVNDVQTGEVVSNNPVSQPPGTDNFASVVNPNAGENNPNPDGSGQGEMPNGFAEEFWAILEQAGVSKRTFFIILILVVGAIILLVFWLTSLGDDSPDTNSDSEEDLTLEENLEDIENQNNSDSSGNLENSNGSDNLSNLPDSVSDSTGANGSSFSGQLHPVLELAFLLGTAETVSFGSPLAERLALIQTMQNFYFTDIYLLLDQADDRAEVLNQHLERMRELIDQGNQTVLALDQEMADIEAQFEVIFDEREGFELQYFEALEAFDADTSEYSFQNFVEKYQLEVELRANFNSKKFLRDSLAEVLEVFIPRYQDITLNKEAILQGIKIIDVPSSNVQTILDFDSVLE